MEAGIHNDLRDMEARTDDTCAACISRRSFVAKSAGLAAVAAFFAACGEGGGITDPVGATQVKVSNYPGLATLNKLVLIDGQRAAKRTGPDTFAAYSRSCTHEGTAVNVVGQGASFECPNHGARFNNNGQVTLGPAERNLTVLTTSYDAATDMLTIG